MDSFYDLQHSARAPFNPDTLFMRPQVPEASLLLENAAPKRSGVQRRPDEHLSYNAWKCRPQSTMNALPMPQVRNKENDFSSSPTSSSILRKQVRFQSPVLPQKYYASSTSEQVQRQACDEAAFSPTNLNKNTTDTFNSMTKMPSTDTVAFQDIYMANIPNRKLDLSIIDPPASNKSAKLDSNENVSQFARAEKKLANPVYDILNYQSPEASKSKQLNCDAERLRQRNTCSEDQDFYYTQKYDAGHRFKSQNYNSRQNPDNLHSPRRGNFNNAQTPLKATHFHMTETFDNDPNAKPSHLQRNPYRNKETRQSDNSLMEVSSRNIARFSKTPERSEDCHSDSLHCNDAVKETASKTSTDLVPSNNLDDQPTVRELLKIIQQQNDQLLILQKQVACLIDTQHSQQKAIESHQQKAIESHEQKAIETNRQQQQIQHEPFQVFDKKPSAIPNKFNIDVMTSFEVSIRPQQQKNARVFDGFQEAKIREVTEEFDSHVRLKDDDVITEFDATAQTRGGTDMSMMLREPLQVQEGRMSPEQSVHVDMQDYSSDSDCESNASSDLGWTIYNNVMGQVNNILTKANVAKMEQNVAQQTTSERLRSKTMKKVKEATLKHLQSIGVSVPMEETTDSIRTQNSSDGLEYSPTEVSFAVKQLLMKYLPSEHLAKLGNIPDEAQHGRNRHYPKKGAPKVNLVPRRSDFSFATVQYMKKYNLMASLDEEGSKVAPKPAPIHQQKFLDITALKQQPKLL